MKIFKNKKADTSGEVVQHIPRIIFTISLTFAVILIVGAFILSNVDIRKSEVEIYTQALLFSKNGISYYDKEIDRVYPLIIDITDINKTQENMDNHLYFGEKNNRFGAKITYYLNSTDKKEIYYNKQYFKYLKPLKTLGGPGGSYMGEKNLDITFIYNYETYPGKIKLEVVVPNE